jgi:hypothetical protein
MGKVANFKEGTKFGKDVDFGLLIDFRTVHHTKPGPQKNPKPKQQTRP